MSCKRKLIVNGVSVEVGIDVIYEQFDESKSQCFFTTISEKWTEFRRWSKSRSPAITKLFIGIICWVV